VELTTSKARRVVVGLVLVATAVAGQGGLSASARSANGDAPAAVTAAAAPTPTAAVPGKPTIVAAVGDSITQSTGTGPLSKENPKNSWATGTEVSSVAARLGIPTANRYNFSTNGDRMSDFAPQIQNGKSGGSGDVPVMPTNTGLVLVEFGGNDLCRDTVAQMTPVETYRAQFKAGLAAVANRAPNALIQVMSVPDIYNLWYIRGAPQNDTYHPEAESGQASGINGARFYWDGLTAVGVKFPCQSLLTNPDSYSAADRQRRLDVRTRNKAYNAVLAEECGKVLRCRFDGNRLFDLTSNRVTPPDGPLLPQNLWAFTDLDISRNTASFCPIPGLTGDGCGDHFHPSKQGQGKIADSATIAGRNWADTTMPTAGATVLPSGRPDGANRFSATVRFSGSDAGGLRGQEVRIQSPDGTRTAWTPSFGIAPDLTITKLGTSYVEVRSLDVNGNLSASTVTPVEVVGAGAPWHPNAPAVTATKSGMTVSWNAPDDGGSPITEYAVTPYAGTPDGTAGNPIATTARTINDAMPKAGELVRYRVQAKNAIGTGPLSDPSAPTIAPFSTLEAFVRQQHADFTMYKPEPPEVASNIAALTAGTWKPSDLVVGLRSSVWFDGAYGPAIRLYRAYFLRNPDPSGLDFWANRRRNGYTLSSISQQFAVSSEFKRRYGSLSNAAFIDAIYRNVFDRAPDPSGRDFYLRHLNDRSWNRGQVVLQFSESNEYKGDTNALVMVIELARGMNGKAPSPALVDELLAVRQSGGDQAVFAALVSGETYRTRILG
jgi:lysophospholipase L1-like esterase